MPDRFCVLASGSSGNSTFVQANGVGLLIDAGLGPRLLAARLASIGASWRDVHAVLLTHTHTDHWKDLTFRHLLQYRVPLYCSPEHHESLARGSSRFVELRNAGFVRPFVARRALTIGPAVTVRPFEVPHDSEPTFAFRLDGPPGLFGPTWSLGYAADLGEVPESLAADFADVQVLALEFNHCEQMERMSGRPKILIDRVLGPQGHLSNAQAALAVEAIVRASAPGVLRHLVLLHLSRECNRPSLAAAVGRAALARVGNSAHVFAAKQSPASHVIGLDSGFDIARPRAVDALSNSPDI